MPKDEGKKMISYRRIMFRDFLEIAITLMFGCIIGVLSIYIYESRVYPIVQVVHIINPSQAPSDYFNESQFHFYNGSFCVDMKNDYYLSSYAPTGSMIPTLSERANGIEINIESPNDVHVGDIVSYSKDNETIVHRIINIENDSNGTIYTFLGDANLYSDEKVPYSRLLRKTVALLY